ncbi:MAG: DUF1367 family protein [Leptonema sp. (in: bacteria)]
MEFLMYKDKGKLLPLDVIADEFMRLENGVYIVKLKKDRNIKHHRKFFAILNIAYNNMDYYNSVDDVLDDIKINLGLYDVIEVDGKKIVKLKSIAFDKMDEIEFSEFYNKAIKYIAGKLGVSEEELENATEDYF